MEAIFKGATDQTLYFVLVDSSTGLPKTAIAHTDVTGSYVRNRGTRTAITMANLAAPDSAHSDGGWEEVDATNTPGLYRFDIPDAAFATGAPNVIVTVKATGCKTEHQIIPLWNWNTQVAAIPNAAADAAGGLIISDAGGLDADALRADVAAILVDTGTTLDARIPAALVSGRIDASVGAMAAGVVTATAIATAAIDADAISADAALEIAGAVWDEARAGHTTAGSFGQGVASVQGNVTGSVASVTGAVGEVTGAVGSVASGGITSASFAAGAINAAAIATDAIDADAIAADAIGASELAASALSEISGVIDPLIPTAAQNADAVWDEDRSLHVVSGSFGQALQLIRNGTAQAGASTTITLDIGASSVDDFYNNGLVQLIGGTGIGQARYITDYVGSTRVATVSVAWATAPDNTSVFAIQPGDAVPGATAPSAADNAAAVWNAARSSHTTAGTFGQGVASVQGAVTGAVGSVTGNVGGNVVGSVASVTGNVGGNVTGSVGTVATNGISAASLAADAGTEIGAAVWNATRSSHVAAGSFGQSLQLVRDGTAQAGASTTITLDASASATNDFYNDTLITVIAGTGAGQSRFISDYVGGTKVATVSAVWSTTPDNTSVFIIETFGAIPGVTAPTAAQVADAVWDELRADHTTSGTFGQGTASVQGNVTGTVASITGNVAGNVTGSVGSLATQAKADVNAEVVDALNVDTYAELSAVPAATASFSQMVRWLFSLARNKVIQSTVSVALRNDADSADIGSAPTSDDGTSFTRGEWS